MDILWQEEWIEERSGTRTLAKERVMRFRNPHTFPCQYSKA